jgi:thiol-disulfide isomerase/thioredoxin
MMQPTMTARVRTALSLSRARGPAGATCIAAAIALALLAAPGSLHAQTTSDSGEVASTALLDGPIHLAVPALIGTDTVKIGRGAPMTLVAVFATWCAGCRDEVPMLNMLQRDFGNKVRIVALDMDVENQPYVKGWLKKYGAQYPVFRNDAGAARILGVMGVPVLYLVNGNGHVEWKRSGALLSAMPELRARLKALPLLAASETR